MTVEMNNWAYQLTGVVQYATAVHFFSPPEYIGVSGIVCLGEVTALGYTRQNVPNLPNSGASETAHGIVIRKPTHIEAH